MKTVQPIREKAKIEAMKKELLKSSERDYLLFVTGINSGLRISDILKLKVSDVRNKTHVHIKEQKTSKEKIFKINDSFKKAFIKYTKGMADDEYLFQSRKGDNVPITRIQAYRVLNKAAEAVGLEEIGTHTLRKTFGYWHFKQYNDITKLQKIFNHSTPFVTLDYIGITQDEMDEEYDGLNL